MPHALPPSLMPHAPPPPAGEVLSIMQTLPATIKEITGIDMAAVRALLFHLTSLLFLCCLPTRLGGLAAGTVRLRHF